MKISKLTLDECLYLEKKLKKYRKKKQNLPIKLITCLKCKDTQEVLEHYIDGIGQKDSHIVQCECKFKAKGDK